MSNQNEKKIEMANFVSALDELKKIDEKKNRYTDIDTGRWFECNNGEYKVSQKLSDIEKTKMCKYLMYLFAGALAKDVNKVTGDVLAKGLNKKIKDMSNEDFVQYVKKIYIGPANYIKGKAETKLMNDTAPYQSLSGTKIRPSDRYNDGIWKMSCYILDFLGEIKEGKDMRSVKLFS